MLDMPRRDDSNPRILIIYAYTGRGLHVAGDVQHALAELRVLADQLVVIVPPTTTGEARAELSRDSDALLDADADSFMPSWYPHALSRLRDRMDTVQQIVLTGDSWFGPVGSLEAAGNRVASDVDLWQMTQNSAGTRSGFTPDGSEQGPRPFVWVQARADLFSSGTAATYWAAAAKMPGAHAEWRLNRHFDTGGYRTGYAFSAHDFPSPDPAIVHAELLIDVGCPLVDKAVFQSYPPALDRHGVIGREIVAAVEAAGYSRELMLEGLARTTAPKTLNTNAGMLEVIDDVADVYDDTAPFRVAVLARVTDLDSFDEMLRRVGNLPGQFDTYFTVKDGMSAARVQRRLDDWWADRDGRFEVRVTPSNRGRDMSDLFVACRDVLVPGRYDLIVKLHLRDVRYKTFNLARYFRRYQFENLLDGPTYARNVLALFQQERGLGLVFPPMMHVGYATMGSGWAGLETYAQRLCARIGIETPLDAVSPLSPDGRMWVARPEALALLSGHRWSFSDYGRSHKTWHGHLAQIQERLIVSAAAQLGYHVRTILTAEHAAIGHTALDFKVDELFSTTRGYPVEQIQLMHRAGYAGYGGPVAISRMYVNLNHRKVASLLRPVYKLLFRLFAVLAPLRRMLRRAQRKDVS